MQLDIRAHYSRVVFLHSGESVGHVLAVVIWNLDISAPDDNVHMTSTASRNFKQVTVTLALFGESLQPVA
jgi:hypothetical protein